MNLLNKMRNSGGNAYTCNTLIKEANNYLGIDENDGVTAQCNASALSQKKQALLSKFPNVAFTFQGNSFEESNIFNSGGPRNN